ncbi:MAG: hypothetical protein HY789_12300 [Deltaproteobacteria bacterium]|nr:hypothetical protein [Deltaproteobacteria bacterium]
MLTIHAFVNLQQRRLPVAGNADQGKRRVGEKKIIIFFALAAKIGPGVKWYAALRGINHEFITCNFS